MTKPWQTKEWKARREEVIKDACEICGKGKSDGKTLVLHHPAELEQAKRVPKWHPQAEEINKKADEFYMSLEGTQTLCKGCHASIHRGWVLCPLCNKQWMKPAFECCFECLPEDRKQEITAKKELEAEWEAGYEKWAAQMDAEMGEMERLMAEGPSFEEFQKTMSREDKDIMESVMRNLQGGEI